MDQTLGAEAPLVFLYLHAGRALRPLPDRLDGLEEIRAVAPQGIDEDRRHAGRHGNHAPDRIDPSSCGRWNPQPVKQESEHDVLHDLAVTVAADLVGVE